VPDQFPHDGEAQSAVPVGRLLDRAETAERLHVSRMTVRRLGAAGLLEEIRVGARAVRITEQSIERHLADGRARPGTRSSEGAIAT
jgi:excisionase family DNA binding protein